MLNQLEKDLIAQTIVLSNQFFHLDGHEGSHPMDRHEFAHHMHQIQRLIMVRPTRRDHPDIFLHSVDANDAS